MRDDAGIPQDVEQAVRNIFTGRVAVVDVGEVNDRDPQLHIRLREREDETVTTPLLFVGNNRYAIVGLKIGSRAALAGGSLWICTAPRASRIERVRMGLRALAGCLPHALAIVVPGVSGE